MVRSYLIENRICFESDKGAGAGNEPDRSNPAEMAQREARARASVGFGTQTQGGPAYSTLEQKEAFADQVARGDFDTIQEAERQAAQRQADAAASQAQARAEANRSMAGMNVDRLVRQAAGRSPYAPRETSPDLRSTAANRFIADAYQDLLKQNPRGTTLQQIAQTGPANRLISALTGRTQRSPREEAAYQAGQMLSQITQYGGKGGGRMTPEMEAGLFDPKNPTSPMFDPGTGTFTDVPIGSKGGTMSTGIFGGPVYTGPPDDSYSGPFEDQVRGFRGEDRTERGDDKTPVSVFGGQMDTSAVGQSAANAGAIPSSELAIDYLQNPYFQYSGFGNQFFPYGYAPNTLVDLLQTRNLTQPSQADTLGLFGNPTDFS